MYSWGNNIRGYNMVGLLKYYIKKRAYIVGIISIILILLAILFFKDGYIYNVTGERDPHAQNFPVGYYAFISSVLLLIVPMFEFSFKMRKVSIDEFYSFPIKREKLYIVKYIIGLLEVLIPMTVFFLFTLFDILLSPNVFHIDQYIVYYLLSIPTIAASYSIITFIYAKCNTVHDGIINVILVQFFFAGIAYIIGEIASNRDICLITNNNYFTCRNHWDYFFIFSPIVRLSSFYESFMRSGLHTEDPFGTLSLNEIATIISMIFFLVIGITSFILLITLQKYEKSEDSMDIANSWFSYKIMLPTYIAILSTICIYEKAPIFVLLVAILGYIGYAIYRRNFKIKLYDIITSLSCLVGGVILGVLIW